MIVRNEERQLAAGLEPIAALFDQIVIVDTGSRDRTREIAATFTDEVFEFAWCDDFSAARNASLARAQGDWVFWYDADDRMRSEQVAQLQALLQNLDERPAVYLMDTVCPARYECEAARLITHGRLFWRHPDLRWQGRVHEQLRPDPVTLGYELIRTDIQIDHVGYLDAVLRQQKLQRDVRLLRMDYAVDPEDLSTLLHLGLAYSELGNRAEARKYLSRLVQADRGPAVYMRRVYGVLTELSLRDGNPQQALEAAGRGLFLFPGDATLLYLRAEALYELDRYEAARQALEEIVTQVDLQSQQCGGGLADVQQKLAPRKLGDVLRVLREFSAAEAVLRKVVAVFPQDTHSWYTLGRVCIDSNQGRKLEEVLAGLRSCPQGNVFAALLQTSWHLMRNELEPAGALIDRLISDVPQMPLPRILRADWLTRSRAPLEARIGACRDLLRIQPGNVDMARTLSELEDMQRSGHGLVPSHLCTNVVVGVGLPAGRGAL